MDDAASLAEALEAAAAAAQIAERGLATVCASSPAMEALGSSPAPPRRMRLVSTSSGPVRRRARRGFPHQQPADIDMQLGLECDSGDATHLVDDHGEMMPTPQALRNVLRDPGVRAILSKQRAAILAAMGKEASLKKAQ